MNPEFDSVGRGPQGSCAVVAGWLLCLKDQHTRLHHRTATTRHKRRLQRHIIRRLQCTLWPGGSHTPPCSRQYNTADYMEIDEAHLPKDCKENPINEPHK